MSAMTEPNATPGTLRRRIDRLIDQIRRPNAPVVEILEAEAVLGRLYEGSKKVSREVFAGIERASGGLVDGAVGFDPSSLTMIDPVLKACRRAKVDEARMSLVRQVIDASETARVHGLWVEFLFLRSAALVMAEPTGIALSALRSELYRKPSGSLLIELSLDSSDSTLSAAMEAARVSLDLAEAIAEANAHHDSQKEN